MERRETKALQLPFAATPPPHTKKALDLCGLYAAKSASLMSKETKKLWSQTVPKKFTEKQIQTSVLSLHPSPSRLQLDHFISSRIIAVPLRNTHLIYKIILSFPPANSLSGSSNFISALTSARVCVMNNMYFQTFIKRLSHGRSNRGDMTEIGFEGGGGGVGVG